MSDAERLARFVGWEKRADGWMDLGGSRLYKEPIPATIEEYIAACEARGWLYILQSKEDGTHHAWLTGQYYGSGPSARAALEAAILKALETME